MLCIIVNVNDIRCLVTWHNRPQYGIVVYNLSVLFTLQPECVAFVYVFFTLQPECVALVYVCYLLCNLSVLYLSMCVIYYAT